MGMGHRPGKLGAENTTSQQGDGLVVFRDTPLLIEVVLAAFPDDTAKAVAIVLRLGGAVLGLPAHSA